MLFNKIGLAAIAVYPLQATASSDIVLDYNDNEEDIRQSGSTDIILDLANNEDEEETPTDASEPEYMLNLAEILSGPGPFTTVAEGLDMADLVEALSGPGHFTVFAPINDAFEKLPEELGIKLGDPIWKPQLQDLLLYHVIDVPPMAFTDGMTVTALNGEDLLINLYPPRVNDNSYLLLDEGLVDIEADNGMIHGIDTVLTPASVTSTIVDIAAGKEELSILVEALKEAGLAETLAGEGPFTVLAPDNKAFEALPEGTLVSLDAEQLTDILTYHVIQTNAHSSDVYSGKFSASNGDCLDVEVSDEGIMVNGANVVYKDIIASNGIIHIIDSVLLPPVVTPPTETPKDKKQKGNKRKERKDKRKQKIASTHASKSSKTHKMDNHESNEKIKKEGKETNKRKNRSARMSL